MQEFFSVSSEYISILILINRLDEAHEVVFLLSLLVAEAIDSIDMTMQASLYQRKITNLVIFKAQIFYKLGYLEDAYSFYSKVQGIIVGQSKQINDLDQIQHIPFFDAVDYLECVLGITAIDIELSRYDIAEKTLQRCEQIVSEMFSAKDCDLARRIKILRLNMAKDLLDFQKRNDIADELSEMYQHYDHYRLIRCEDFMQFVKERITYLIDDCKHDQALLRVENIISILDPNKQAYWYRQYRILEAKCLINNRKSYLAYDILHEILHNIILKKDSSKLKDFRLFVDVHLELGMIHLHHQATVTTSKKITRTL